MNKVLTVVIFLLMSIGAWAGEVIIVKNPSNGGTVTASTVTAGQTCTVTVVPTDGNYLKSIKAVTTVNGNAIQAPVRRTGIDIDETELTITSDATADPRGKTTHTFTMPEDVNLNVEVTAEFETLISISNAIVTLAENSFTYDGTAKEPAVASVKLGQNILATNEYSVSYNNNINVSAAVSPTVTVTGLRQYTGTATATFTISAKSITSDMITLSPTTLVFCGETQAPGVTVTDGNTELNEEDYTIGYQLVNGEIVVDVEETRDVATYNVVVTGQGNYGGSATKSFEITKAQLENLSVSLEGWTYGEQPEEIEATVEGNEEEGDMTFYYKAKGADDNTYSENVPVNAGIYTIKVEVAETANYASGSAIGDFTIDKAPLTEGLTVNITGWKYGATPNTPSVDGNLGNGTVTYTYKDAEDDEAEFSEDVPTNVGSYIVKATVAETANYYGGEAYNEFSIEKGDLTMVSASLPEELIYDSTEKQLITVENVPEGATAKYYWEVITETDFNNSEYDLICDPEDNIFTNPVPTATNAGYYAIIYKVFGGDNYNDKLASPTMKVAIYPAEITELTIDETPLVYTGEAQTVTITSVKAGTINLTANDYTVSYEMVITGEAPAPVDAPFETGTYNVIVTGEGNFAGSKSASFTIINRTLSADEVTFHEGWATYCSLDEDVNLPAGIGAYVATGLGDGVVTLTQISYIPTEVPVLLNNATTTTTSNTEFEFNLLRYAPEAIVVDDAKYYGLYNGKFMRVTGTIPERKVFLYAEEPNASQLTIVIDNEDNFTSVNDVKIKMNEVDGNIYDLTGRKLQNLSKKGLYIQNGRKVVVK